MSHRRWPNPGQGPIARSKMMTLAYRAALQHREAEVQELRYLLDNLDLTQGLELRELIDAYLEDKSPFAGSLTADELDRRFHDWGEEWHCDIEDEEPDPDDLVTAKVAARLIQVRPDTISALRRRRRITGILADPRRGPRGGFLYLVRDVYRLAQEVRRRGSALNDPTDTITASGRSDPK